MLCLTALAASASAISVRVYAVPSAYYSASSRSAVVNSSLRQQLVDGFANASLISAWF